MLIVSTDKNIPEGFRRLTEEEIAEQFLKIDSDQNYFITKNEWMMHFIRSYEKDLDSIDAEGPDALMKKIQEISDEFDKIDTDGSKEIDFLEYKAFVENNVFISE